MMMTEGSFEVRQDRRGAVIWPWTWLSCGRQVWHHAVLVVLDFWYE